MEYNYLNKSHKHLIIGELSIACYMEYKNEAIKDRIRIPFSGMAFYNPKAKNVDLVFKIDKIEEAKRKELLFGSEDFMIPTFLYQLENDEYDWITKNKDGENALAFRISSDWKQFTLYEDTTCTKGERAFHEFGSLFSYAMLNFHACVLHGVVMEYKGHGILITAASGVGKTTHTRMWRDHKNALIINGDRCLCRKTEDGWYAYGMPWSGSSGEYINRKVKISHIVALKQDEYNHVEEMSVYNGTIYLMQRIFAPVWPCEMQNKAFDICEELANEISMLELYCKPDLESVEVLERTMHLDERE